MYGYQPEEYSDPYYGDAHVSYAAETGHNEFPYYPQQGGKATVTPIKAARKTGAHAKNNLRRLEQDRAVALEAERAEIIEAMWKLNPYIGYRAVGVQIVNALANVTGFSLNQSKAQD